MGSEKSREQERFKDTCAMVVAEYKRRASARAKFREECAQGMIESGSDWVACGIEHFVARDLLCTFYADVIHEMDTGSGVVEALRTAIRRREEMMRLDIRSLAGTFGRESLYISATRAMRINRIMAWLEMVRPDLVSLERMESAAAEVQIAAWEETSDGPKPGAVAAPDTSNAGGNCGA